MHSPTERIKARLMREACREVATKHSQGLLDIEERYSLVRTHLMQMHTSAPTMTNIQDLVEELLPLARRFLAEVSSIAPRDYVHRLSDTTAALSKTAKEAFEHSLLKREHVQTFLEVLESYRKRCLSEGYDPTGLVPTEVMLLAVVIEANFDTYGAAFNAAG